MSDSSDPDYEVVITTDSSDEDITPEPEPCAQRDTKKQIDPLLRELLDMGQLRVDNITEIQHILKAIYECNAPDEMKKQMGLCFNMLISLSNQFLEQHKNL